MTRIGKTASAHLLAGNPLKGFKKGGQEMVDVTTSKNSSSNWQYYELRNFGTQ
jgi:hypothetical protein